MATQQDLILRDLVDSVQQRPLFTGVGRPKQVVVVSFHTPHDFTGSVTMTPEDWADPETRFEKITQAVVDLEGPFWDTEKQATEGG